MSLNFGRTQVSIPGPSVIPDRVLAAMHRASPNIYGGEIADIVESIIPDLKKVARTKHDVVMYITNGHGAWEAAVANTLNAGDKVLVLGTGRFGPGWGELAGRMGVDVELLDFGMHSVADPSKVEDALRADTSQQIKAVLTVQTDTASAARNDIPAIRAAIDAAEHPALFMVDCICSLGCEQHEMDAWGVDLMVSACQKGLMTPAGLGFVFFNDKARAARETSSPSYVWDWKPRATPTLFYQNFAGTAPTHSIFALREALDILVHEEGVEAAWARHRVFAEAIWDAIDVWGQGGSLRHNIKNRADRSFAVSAISTGDDEARKIRAYCEDIAGVTLGVGLGMSLPGTPEWDRNFRIGHMGHLNVPMVIGVLGAIDAAMKAHNIPHGSGALEAASARIAKG